LDEVQWQAAELLRVFDRESSVQLEQMHAGALVHFANAAYLCQLPWLSSSPLLIIKGMSRAQISQGLVGDVARLQAGLQPVIIDSSSGGRRAMHLDEVRHLS
jgi:hypothetical protein